MKLYQNGDWHCFGCHLGGSVIDWVMLSEDCSFAKAVKTIDQEMDFSLLEEADEKDITDRQIRQTMIDGAANSMLEDIDREAEKIEKEAKEEDEEASEEETKNEEEKKAE